MQAALFHSIKPLFANKPLMVVCNKTDVTPLSEVSPADRELLREMHEAANTDASTSAANDVTLDTMPCMSTLTEEAVAAVKAMACEKLLTSRVEQKLKGKNAGAFSNSLLNTYAREAHFELRPTRTENEEEPTPHASTDNSPRKLDHCLTL
jgi:nucleolar GTP-binding protein